MKHFIHLAQIALSLTACLLYPSWIRDGYLDELYPMIGAFIASYGGFIGGVIWYINFLRK